MSDFTGRLGPGETNFVASRPLTQAEADQLYFPIDGDLGTASFGVSQSEMNAAIQSAINTRLTRAEADALYLSYTADLSPLLQAYNTAFSEMIAQQQILLAQSLEAAQADLDSLLDGHRNEIPAHRWEQISEKPNFDLLYRPIQTPIDWAEIINVPAIATDWDSIEGKPTEFPPTIHTHSWNQITNPPETATRWSTWTEVTSKPSTFPPSNHTHIWTDITGKPATATRWPSWEEVTTKPSFDTLYRAISTPIQWNEIADVPTFATDWSSVTGKPSQFTPAVHAPTHASNGSDSITPAMIGAEVSGAAAAAIAAHLAASNPHPQYAGGGTGGTTTYNVIRSSPAFVEEWDDFLSLAAANKLGWSIGSTNGFSGAEAGNRFPGTKGVFTLGINGTNQNAGDFAHLRLGNFPVRPLLSEGYSNIEMSAVVGLANTSQTALSWSSRFGLLDTGAGNGTASSILISAEFMNGQYNWVAVWRTGTGVANFQVITPVTGNLLTKTFNLHIKIDCENSKITFTVDGVSFEAIITPSSWQFAAMSPIFVIRREALLGDTQNRSFWVDKYLFRKNVSEGPADTGGTVTEIEWANVLNKPLLFPPTAHGHTWNEIASIPETANRWPTWDETTNKPTTFTPSAHTHPWSQITSVPTTASRWPTWTEVTSKPDFATLYRGLTDPIDWADIVNVPPSSGGNVSWENVLNKPTTFTPSIHSHGWNEITSIPTTATRWPTWTEVTSKPTTFTPSAHGHAWADITGVPVFATRWPDWTEVTSRPAAFPPEAHTHAWSQITSPPVQATRWPAWGEVTSNPFSAPVSWGSVTLAGSSSSYAGIRFSSTDGPTTLMVHNTANIQGFHRADTSWQWYFQNGVLTVGTVPWARLTGVPVQTTRWPAFSEVTSPPATATRWPTWAEVTGKPTTFDPVDSGNIAPVMNTGWVSDASVPLYCRKVGNTVFIRGYAARTAGNTATWVATLPTGYRPTLPATYHGTALVTPAGGGGAVPIHTVVTINSMGNLTCTLMGNSNNDTITRAYFDGFTFFVN